MATDILFLSPGLRYFNVTFIYWSTFPINWSVMYLCLEGEDSGRVVIWNMAPVADPATEMDDKVPKMLCQLNNHLGKYFQL